MGAINFFSTLLTCKVLNETQEAGEKREIPQWTKGNFQYNWIGILIIGVPPVMVLLGLLLGYPILLKTFIAAFIWAIITGIVGVTAGYHRLYSHRAYTAGPFMMKLTAFMGAGAFQGSIKWWGRLHRIHHKYTDTDLDPYNAKRGFIFTHFGWFVMRMDYSLLGTADCSDLDENPLVAFQRRNFAYLATVSGILLPWFTCGLLFNDWAGGFFYGAFLKIFIVHQVSFCINSLAHTNWFWARQEFSDELTPHDSPIFTLCNFGEGYHNFHHQFASDYRNGYKWYHSDPTKWYVYICEKLGFCWGLRRTPLSVIERARKTLLLKQLREDVQRLEEEVKSETPSSSEVMTPSEVEQLVKHGRKLIIVDDYVLDLERPIALESSATHPAANIHWLDAHPGGRALLEAYVGRDATEAINGSVYKHTHGAHSLVPELRIAHFKRKE